MVLLVIGIVICLVLLNFRYKQGYSWKDIFSPVRWRAVYVWLLKRNLKYLGENDKYLTTNELLQYSYRVAKCSDCLQAGKCLHCGCDAEGRLNGVTDKCSAGKWKMMLTDEEMSDILKDSEYKFNVEIIKKDNNDRI